MKPGKKGDDKKFYNRIGKVIIHEGGKSGVLFLDMFDGDWALFAAEKNGEGDGGGE